VNVVRFLPTVAGYACAHDGQDIYVNQYLGSRARVTLKEGAVTLTQQTRYPWDGLVKLIVEPEREEVSFALFLRIPGWCQGPQTEDDLYRVPEKPRRGAARITVNGRVLRDFQLVKGYARLNRNWRKGDQVELDLPMPVQRVRAHPKVQANVGRVALQRGPIVYCLEGVDNDGVPRSLALGTNTSFSVKHQPDLLNGVTVVIGQAMLRQKGTETAQPFGFRAVPYYAWDNRAPGQMLVWLPEEVSLAEPRPLPTIASQSTPSASHKHGPDALEAMNDQLEPKASNDHSLPRFTWWDHRGTREWVQYDFKSPATVSAVEVYWFDDTGTGQCRVPKSWRVLHKDNGYWKAVAAKSDYATKTDAFNKVGFAPVQTTGLRVEVELQPEFSGGILEWRVLE
jgi:hypothetical protein